MIDNSKVFVYMNPLASIASDMKPVKQWIDEKLHTNQWVNASGNRSNEILKQLIEEFQEDTLFFAGMAFEQYRMTVGGGIFINPMIGGLNTDYDTWSKVIKEDGAIVLYLEVPFNVYRKAIEEEDYKVDEKSYDIFSTTMKTMVESLNCYKHLH